MALSNFKYTQSLVRRANGYLSGSYTASSVASETTKSATSNAEGVASCVIGSGVMTITLGWIPKRFTIINATDRLTQEWYQGLNTGDFLETVAAGDRTLETDDKLTVSASTGVVVVTFDGGAVTDSDTVVWFAEG